MAYEVKFLTGTMEQYQAITPNPYTFYFLTDTQQVFLGDTQLSNVNVNDKINVINGELRGKATIIRKPKIDWESNIQISKQNTIYVYTDRDIKTDGNGNVTYIPGVKIGDGLAYIVDLPFIDDLFYTDHMNNSNIHVTLEQKQAWNNKLHVQEQQNQEVLNGVLYLNVTKNNNN